MSHETDPAMPGTTCESLRPLLFAAAEGGLDRGERLEVNAHLAVCAACRSAERGERALTALLLEPPPVARRTVPSPWRRAAAGLGVVAAALVLLALPAAAPHGSLIQREFGPELAWRTAVQHELAPTNEVAVPVGAAVEVQIGDTRLASTGPARFRVDADGRGWRVRVEEGAVHASVADSTRLVVGGDAEGDRVLAAGEHLVTVARTAALAAQDPVENDPAVTLARGLERFGAGGVAALRANADAEQRAMVDAERLLRQALALPGLRREQRNTALFYLAASLGRQQRVQEAFDLQQQWLVEFPDDEKRWLVQFFQAIYLDGLGQRQEALALLDLVAAAPAPGTVVEAARAHAAAIRARTTSAAPAQDPRSAERAAAGEAMVATAPAPAPAPSGTRYFVVAVDLPSTDGKDGGFRAAAGEAARFHDAQLVDWDGRDFAALDALLRARTPRDVLFVLRPATLDLVLHRRILLASARIDGDIFADFAFGYLTAESGEECQRLWQRIRALHECLPVDGPWLQASVCTADRSFDVPSESRMFPAAAGFDAHHHYFATGDAERERVVDEALRALANAAVAEFTGCGDPQGIWLFSDRRNLERDKHWDYAPDRVGDDPRGEMPRLLAQRFRGVKLPSTIVWSGTCHSGAVDRVFVEGDIVSTFGRTDVATVHRLAPEDSLALSWLHAGAAALLVPLGANHGMSVCREVDFALTHGSSLGEAIKSTWDDVLLAANGELALDLPLAGQPHRHGEQVMQGGGANRILIGDPALRPFRAAKNPIEQVEVTAEADGRLAVRVARAEGFAPLAWDMYGAERGEDWRIGARVRVGETAAKWRVTMSTAGNGQPFRLRRAIVEDFDGERFVHVRANAPRAGIENRAAEVTFVLEAKQ